MRHPPLIVVMTGQMRNPTVFKAQLEELDTSRLETEVHYATWSEEISEHKEFLLKCVKEHSFLKVYKLDSPVNSYKEFDYGNLVPRMFSYHRIFGVFEGNPRILVSRPDVFFDLEYLRTIISFDCELSISPSENFPNLLQEKIVLLDAEVTDPFYSSDLLICGTLEDLRKLVSLDLRFNLLFQTGPARFHNRRFSAPFINCYPILLRFFNSHAFMGTHQRPFMDRMHNDKHQRPLRLKILEHLIESPIYAHVLALYYKILSEYFYILRPTTFWFRTIPCDKDLPVPSSPVLRTLVDGMATSDFWGDGGELFAQSMDFFTNALEQRGIPASMQENFQIALDWLNTQRAVFTIPNKLNFNQYEEELKNVYFLLARDNEIIPPA